VYLSDERIRSFEEIEKGIFVMAVMFSSGDNI
jgi:hypothetical protein